MGHAMTRVYQNARSMPQITVNSVIMPFPDAFSHKHAIFYPRFIHNITKAIMQNSNSAAAELFIC